MRPVKYAFFVFDNDMAAISAVIQRLCNQWGGIRSLIVPVRPDFSVAPVFLNWLRLNQPDRFVHYFRPYPSNERVEAFFSYLRELWPHREIWPGTVFEWHHLGYADISHIADVIPQRILDSNVPAQSYFPAPQLDPHLLALFGDVRASGYFAQTGRRTMAATGSDSFIARAWEGVTDEAVFGSDLAGLWQRQFDTNLFASPLNLTGYGIAPTYAAETNVGFYTEILPFHIVFVSSASALCLYWNLRATRESTLFYRGAGRRVFMLPEAVCSNKSALQRMLSFIVQNFPYADARSNLHMYFWTESKEEELKLQAYLAGLPDLTEFAYSRLLT